MLSFRPPEPVALIGDRFQVAISLPWTAQLAPESALLGGERGSELPIRMLDEARRRLKAGGRLFLPTGTLQDEDSILDTAKTLYSKVRKLTERAIPLPSQLAESGTLKDLVDRGIVKITPRGSRYLWEARVWEVSGVVQTV